MIPVAAIALFAASFEARVLWVDATANLPWTLDTAKVAEFCSHAKSSGFNELIVDVKPINGGLLIAAPKEERFSAFRDIRVPVDYDLLDTFIRAGHKVGLRISAGINVFSEGHSHFPGVGLAYQRAEWQAQCALPTYTAVLRDGTEMPILLNKSDKLRPGALKLSDSGYSLPSSQAKVIADPSDSARVAQGIDRVEGRIEIRPQTAALPDAVAVFVDPVADGVRERILDILRRIAKYDVDGIVLDRMRFADVAAGMGPAMRDLFVERYGPVSSWPESVFTADPDPAKPMHRGPRFADWMRFRAEVVTEFLRDARRAVKEVKPGLPLGAYVGAGWETYFEVGVNYASDRATPPYDWADPEYGLAGYAGYLDFLMPGCFYKTARGIDPGVSPGMERFTVEGAAQLVGGLAGASTHIYPALYGLDWEKNEAGLREAIRQCRKNGSGMMFFDASYVVKNNWWSLFAAEFTGAPSIPPHGLPGLRPSKNSGN